MNIDLNSFEREKAVDETLPLGAVDLDLENARIVSAITIIANTVKAAGAVVLTGRLTGTVEIDCDRCLERVERPIDIELDLEFVPDRPLAEATVELHAEDLKRDEMAGSEISLVDISREQIVLDLPQQFFCRDDCKGLCEKCGTNLNFKDCDCEDNEIDPRWAALQNLN